MSATYHTRKGNDGEFAGTIQVRNPGRTAQNWSISLQFRSGVTVTRVSNAIESRRGSTIVLSGGPLVAGSTETVGFRAQNRDGHGSTHPTSCTINGVACG